MSSFNFLTLDEVLAIHYDQINRYGGSHGVRDLDLLISAINRCQATFSGEDLYPDLFSKASALLHSLILNHPFIDGNKRTAMATIGRFLFINNFALKVTKKELVQTALKIASKKLDLDNITLWLKNHSKKI